MITSNEMMNKAKKIVFEWYKKCVSPEDKDKITTVEDVFVVWFSKTLQNWKALVTTTALDGMYFEVTHNGDKNETYVDVYSKATNFTVKGE